MYCVQRAYVRQRLGQADAALEGYEAALRRRPTDAEVAAVASNNLFALRGREQSLFDSAKKARALNLEEGVESKLTVHQRRVFALNRCLLALYTNSTKECGRALSKLEKEFEGSELPTLVRAALLARERRMEECRALLQAHAAEHPRTAALVKLTLAQLQVNEGDRAGAARTLESIEGAHRMPGVVGSIVRLCEGAAPGAGAPRPAEALEAALRAAEADGASGRDAVRRLVLLAAEQHARAGGAGRAAEMLERLVRGGDRDPAVVARLVSAMAEVDLDRAEEHARLLPALEAAEDVDVQELEAGPARAGGAGGADGARAALAGLVGVAECELRRRLAAGPAFASPPSAAAPADGCDQAPADTDWDGDGGGGCDGGAGWPAGLGNVAVVAGDPAGCAALAAAACAALGLGEAAARRLGAARVGKVGINEYPPSPAPPARAPSFSAYGAGCVCVLVASLLRARGDRAM